MTDIPILFSAPMVRSVLREIVEPGTGKTETRRLLWTQRKCRPGGIIPAVASAAWFDAAKNRHIMAPSPKTPDADLYYDLSGWQKRKPGDRLWVRERVKAEELDDGQDGVRYEADGGFVSIDDSMQAAEQWVDLLNYRDRRGTWVNSIHMPRWASRITCVVEQVRVERLQAISEQDCEREGIEQVVTGLRRGHHPYRIYDKENTVTGDPRESYASLWRSINGPKSWDENPWVVAVRFRPNLVNIEKMAA